MIPYQMTLDYALAPGWLAPFVTGLQSGTAMGRQCQNCAAISFPPLRVCTCGTAEADWVALPGTAQIELRTYGADGTFGLVKFDGASTRATVRLVDIEPNENTGMIMASDGDIPMLRLTGIAKDTLHD